MLDAARCRTCSASRLARISLAIMAGPSAAPRPSCSLRFPASQSPASTASFCSCQDTPHSDSNHTHTHTAARHSHASRHGANRRGARPARGPGRLRGCDRRPGPSTRRRTGTPGAREGDVRACVRACALGASADVTAWLRVAGVLGVSAWEPCCHVWGKIMWGQFGTGE